MTENEQTEIQPEWKPSPMPKLATKWVCIVCRCNEQSRRSCRVICRRPGERSLHHLYDERFEHLLFLARNPHLPAEDNEGANLTPLAELMAESFDDVICERCDGERWRKIAEDARAMVVNFRTWAERTRDVECRDRPARDPRRIVLEAAWGLVIQRSRDITELLGKLLDA